MFKKNISVEDKIYAVKLYQDGKESHYQIASMSGQTMNSQL